MITFLAEDVAPGTFSRMNLRGCILGDSLALPHVPYELRTNLVAMSDVSNAPDIGGTINIKCRFISKDENEQILFSGIIEKEKVLGNIDPTRTTYRVLQIIPIDLKIPAYGRLKIMLNENGYEHEAIWLIEKGLGSYTGRGAPKKTSDIVTPTSLFDLDSLLGSVLSDIVICDGYLSVSLASFLDKVTNKNAKIRILTNEGRPAKKGDTTQKMLIEAKKRMLLAQFPNLEVRFSHNFHDRIAIIDKNEVYVFGHSLKDLNAGRVTRYSKVLDHEEHKRILDVFEQTWNDAAHW